MTEIHGGDIPVQVQGRLWYPLITRRYRGGSLDQCDAVFVEIGGGVATLRGPEKVRFLEKSTLKTNLTPNSKLSSQVEIYLFCINS